MSVKAELKINPSLLPIQHKLIESWKCSTCYWMPKQI